MTTSRYTGTPRFDQKKVDYTVRHPNAQFESFNRYLKNFPEDSLSTLIPYVFFVRPDLNILNNTLDDFANDDIRGDATFRWLISNAPEVLRSLSTNVSQYHDYIPSLGNKIESMPTFDFSLKVNENTQAFTGYRSFYAGNAIESTTGINFDISFKEDNNLLLVHRIPLLIAAGQQLGSGEHGHKQRQKHQLDADAGDTLHQRGGYPGKGRDTGGKDISLYQSGNHPAQHHSRYHADVKVNHRNFGADKPEHQAGHTAVHGALHRHGGENCSGRHTGEQAGNYRPQHAAHQSVGPGAHHAAQQNRDVHGQKNIAAVGEGMKQHGQHHTQGGAHSCKHQFLDMG